MAEIVAGVREWTGAEARPEERLFHWVVPASCLLHVALATMLSLPPESRRVDAPSDAVAVEVLTPEEFAALSGASGRVPEVAEPVERTPPARSGMVRAARLFAEELLADPKSRQARETLPTLATDERMLQLCNIEAMEQVHRWKAEYEPEFVVAYATADTRIAGNAVAADGGAFRSRDRWYRIRFECEVSPDRARVVAFAFSVGAAIPRSEWERRNLPTAVDPDD